MLDLAVTTALEDVHEPDEIARCVRVRILERVPDAGLRSEVDHPGRSLRLEQSGDRLLVREVDLRKAKPLEAGELAQPRLLESDVVVRVQVVHADDTAPALEEPPRDVHSDEARAAGHEDAHRAALFIAISFAYLTKLF